MCIRDRTGDGVVARIGGDEYACALMTEKKKELLLQELYDAFTVRNEQSDKPYNVTVSIGACALEPGDEHSLADALSLADEQLYEVKKLRKKDVAKIPPVSYTHLIKLHKFLHLFSIADRNHHIDLTHLSAPLSCFSIIL